MTLDQVLQGLQAISSRLTYIPSRAVLERTSLGRELIQAAESCGGIESARQQLSQTAYADEVQIPSLDQQRAGAEVALAGLEGKKRLELSDPGTRKTLGLLSAIPIINERLLPQIAPGTRLKTVICCPTYILPTWMREAERLLKNPVIIPITRSNRDVALQRAKDPKTDILLLGYELSYRQSSLTCVPRELTPQEYDLFERMDDDHNLREKAISSLAEIAGQNRTERFMKRHSRLGRRELTTAALKQCIIEQAATQNLAAESHVAGSISSILSTQPYYAIFDELHNIVDPNSKTGIALENLFKKAKWGVISTGTGIRKELSNLAYIAALMERVHDPDDFVQVFRQDPRLVKAFFDLDANPIRTIEEIDPNIPPAKIVLKQHELTPEETEVYTTLANSDLFYGNERYALLTYALTLPRKILPENIGSSLKDDSLRSRVEQFFDENPRLQKLAKEIVPSKLLCLKDIIRLAKSEGKKVIVATKLTHLLTNYLENELKEFGCIRIDSTLSTEVGEIPLTKSEINRLSCQGIQTELLTYRSQLSLETRQILNITGNELYAPSDRQLALLDFRINSSLSVAVTTYGTLREGNDCQEATILVEYDPTTVPSEAEQMLARLRRSGQKEEVTVFQLVAMNTFEDQKYLLRNRRAEVINHAFESPSLTPTELEEVLRSGKSARRRDLDAIRQLNANELTAFMFASCRGRGVKTFIDVMKAYQNALTLATNYNYLWENSYSGNCARLISELLSQIELTTNTKINTILDAGCGPATVSRISGRKTICVDLNKYQIDHGIDSAEEKGIQNTYFLGSYTDLRTLVPFPTAHHVFDPSTTYEHTKEIAAESLDVIVCSLALDFVLPFERILFFQEVQRTLKPQGHLLLLEPHSVLADTCREQFYKDLTDIGFQCDRELTGTYRANNITQVRGRTTQFEAAAIVCRKIRSELNIESGRTYCSFSPEIETIDINSPPAHKKTKREIQRYKCSGFYNADKPLIEYSEKLGIKLPSQYTNIVSPTQTPSLELPLGIKGLEEVITNMPPQEIEDIAAQLKKLGDILQ